MPRLFDSHSHLDVPEFDGDRADVIARARAVGVGEQLVPAVDYGTWPGLRDTCAGDPGLFPAYGLHPAYLERHRPAHVQALRDSGMAWTLLRPTSFMQNTLAWGARVLDGTFYSPVPDAAFSVVDARDVAEVAATALTEDGHENKAYGLSGPEAVSYRDQAKRVFAAAGREVEVEEIPVETLKRELVRAGVPPWNAEGLSELFEVYASGGAQMVTSGVKDVLDRDPRDIDAFAADHVDSFKEQH